MSSVADLTKIFKSVWHFLDERTRRLMAANEAVALGYGGVSHVHRACGLSRKAIAKGIHEIESGSTETVGRMRRSGAGRKPRTFSDPNLIVALERLVDEKTRGDPESPLKWTCKSTRILAEELGRQRHPLSHPILRIHSYRAMHHKALALRAGLCADLAEIFHRTVAIAEERSFFKS
jgi:hypothetical protein